MKYGKLLQLLLEQMPVDYRDKFLSYKQLKKVINTILQDNSLPTAAFVVEGAPGADGGGAGGNYEERPSVESITARDVAVVWPLAVGLEPAAKRARGEVGFSVETGGEGNDGAGAAGTKRKPGSEEKDVAGNDAEENVATLPMQREVSVGRRFTARVAGGEVKELTKEEENFLHLLNVELEKFNSFFTEKEEDYVIRIQELKQRLEGLRQQNDSELNQIDSNEDFQTIRMELVTLHGEVVLMESYSTLNYTGLVKILKKHDKRTGAVLRLPFIRRVLLQPFFSTELLSQLVKECEALLSTFPPLPIEESIEVKPNDEQEDASSESRKGSFPAGLDNGGIFKSTIAALRTIQEMRKGSSTVSAQSLPPCNLNGNDERHGVVINEKLWGGKISELL